MHIADEIVLHIGFAKTGTTAIQRFMLSKKQELLARRVLWPTDESNHYHLHSIVAEKPDALIQIGDLGLSDESTSAFLDAWRARITEEIEEAAPTRIVLSSEHLNGANIVELVRLRRFLAAFTRRIRVLAYVRDPWSMAISTAQQNLRDGLWAGPTSLAFVLNFSEALERFRVAFDVTPEVHVYRSDIVADFLDWIELGDLIEECSVQENASIGLYTACILSRLNQDFPGFDASGAYIADRARGWMVERLMGAFKDEPPILMSRATVDKIAIEGAWEMRAIERRYFGGRRIFDGFEQRLETILGDDTIRIERLDMETVARGMLAAMRALAEHGVFCHDEIERLRVRSG